MKTKIQKILVILLTLVIGLSVNQLNTKAYDGNYIEISDIGYHHTGTAVAPNGASAWFQNQEIGKIKANNEDAICDEPWAIAGNGQSYTATYEEKIRASLIWYYSYINNNQDNYDRAVASVMNWNDHGYFPQTDIPNYEGRKAEIENDIVHHYDLPSFNGDTITLKPGESITLTDTNNALGVAEEDINSAGVNVVRSGNDITITATDTSTSGDLKLTKVPRDLIGVNIVYKSDSGEQAVIDVSKQGDPVRYGVHIEVEQKGTLELTKKDNKGNFIPNVRYLFSVNADMSDPFYDIRTNENGVITIPNLDPGVIYYQEQETAENLVLNTTIEAETINAGAVASVNKVNNWKQARASISKVDTNGQLINAPAVFGVYAPDGTFIERLTTVNGIATTSLLDYGFNYYFIEEQAPNGYVRNEEPTYFNITENEVTVESEKENIRPTASIKLNKDDRETGTESQAEANLRKGAEYTLFANKDVIDEVSGERIYSNGQTISSKIVGDSLEIEWTGLYVGGDDTYKIKETKPAYGYELDETDYIISTNYVDDQTPVIKVQVTSHEDVIKNKFKITKVIGENITGVQKFEKDAEFIVQLEKEIQEVGIDNARIYDTLITDENGNAESVLLPFAKELGYRVTQTKSGNLDLEIAPSFIVKIESSTTPTQHYVINNQKYTAYPKFEKFLTNTGETITYSGATVKIWDYQTNGYYSEQVGKHRVSEWTTDEEGSVMTNREMPAGKYGLIEVKAPIGTVPLSETLDFTITSSNVHEVNEDGHAIQLVRFGNEAPTGKIIINKSFEEFKTDDEKEALFKVTYSGEKDLLSPATGKTIYTPGQQIVNSLDKDGLWHVKDGLPFELDNLSMGLGVAKYSVEEISTREEYELVTKKYDFVFTKEGNTTLVYEKSVDIENKLKRTDLELTKTNEYTGETIKGIKDFEFTLYADEKLTDVIATAKINELTGKLVFKDIVYGTTAYLKETGTDEENYYLSDKVMKIVFDNKLEGIGKTHSVTFANKPVPKIGTLATGVNGIKELDPTVDNPVQDDISFVDVDITKTYVVQTMAVSDAIIPAIEKETGKAYESLSEKEMQTALAKVLKEQPEYIKVNEVQKGVKYNERTGVHTFKAIIKANTLKDGEGLVFFEWLFDEANYKPVEPGFPGEPNVPVVKHVNPKDPGQTIKFKSPEFTALLNKTDKATDKPVVSAEFEFSVTAYKDGEIKDVFYINGDIDTGIAEFKFKGAGTYDYLEFRETKAPKGYELSEEVKTVEMKDFDSENVYSFVYYNELLPAVSVVTGIDTNNVMYWILGAVACALIILGLGKKGIDKKKKNSNGNGSNRISDENPDYDERIIDITRDIEHFRHTQRSEPKEEQIKILKDIMTRIEDPNLVYVAPSKPEELDWEVDYMSNNILRKESAFGIKWLSKIKNKDFTSKSFLIEYIHDYIEQLDSENDDFLLRNIEVVLERFYQIKK